MTVKVRWFKNGHEQRNYWLRFGLMRLHRAGVIDYREDILERSVNAGFSDAIARHEHRHTSVIAVESGGDKVRCIVDSEDSLFCMAGIIEHADRYFCAGYNADFFQNRHFEPPYAWLAPHEVATYRAKADGLIRTQGAWFDRVRPFVPIGPDLARKTNPGRAAQKVRNLHDKLARRMSRDEPWHFAHLDFEQRYASLLALRDQPARHDVVLLDTLWGWPRHREALHRKLQQISASGRGIHARLNWAEPSNWDGSDVAPLDQSAFPIVTGRVENYEAMLAASRMAVFASGFHWGWRNIMTLALMWGLPVMTDRLFLQPWFDMERFKIIANDDADWDGLVAALTATTDNERARTITHNQKAFDEVLAPEKVAEYFIGAALA